MMDRWRITLEGQVFVDEPVSLSFLLYLQRKYPGLDFKAERVEEAGHGADVQDQGGQIRSTR